LALALCGALDAGAQPRVELAPAWDGWSRPGRMTEIDVRVRSDVASRGTIEVAAGPQVLRTAVDLAAGGTQRLHLPVESAAGIDVSIDLQGARRERRDVAIAQSESPLLGVGLADGTTAALAGFHAIALVAGDLPHNAIAYSSIDALLLDAATLRALDAQQLGALIGHAAACGRIALVGPDASAERLLQGAAGCGGRMLVAAATVSEAMQQLDASLAVPAATTVAPDDLADLMRPDQRAWRRIAAMLAVGVAVIALTAVVSSSIPTFLLVALFASAALASVLQLSGPRERLVVWAEAEPSARVAQYRAWQEFDISARGEALVPIPAGLGNPRACDPGRPVRFDIDASTGRPASAVFKTRLFEPVALCYSGNFPVMRAVGVRPLDADRLEIRNEGSLAWPAGMLAANGHVHALPAMGAGASVTLKLDAGALPDNAAARAALSRTPFEGYAVLWPLELGSVAAAPRNSTAWLLVPVAGQR
jgi:hypothetical protein